MKVWMLGYAQSTGGIVPFRGRDATCLAWRMLQQGHGSGQAVRLSSVAEANGDSACLIWSEEFRQRPSCFGVPLSQSMMDSRAELHRRKAMQKESDYPCVVAKGRPVFVGELSVARSPFSRTHGENNGRDMTGRGLHTGAVRRARRCPTDACSASAGATRCEQ